ncbi:MAG: hypothetical protein HZA17_10310 [Nitrospirae bacterium]|nr:hypothetical protein [Nitrospirota bacterium]
MKGQDIEMTGNACPGCGSAAGDKTVLMEVWEGEGASDWVFYDNWVDRLVFLGRRRIHKITSPPLCGACASALRRKRTTASVLTVMPVLFAAWGLLPDINFCSFAFFFFYSFYLVSRGDYSWADFLVYGAQLRGQFSELVPEKVEKVSMVRFPVPASQCLLRLSLFFVGGFIVLIVRELSR